MAETVLPRTMQTEIRCPFCPTMLPVVLHALSAAPEHRRQVIMMTLRPDLVDVELHLMTHG